MSLRRHRPRGGRKLSGVLASLTYLGVHFHYLAALWAADGPPCWARSPGPPHPDGERPLETSSPPRAPDGLPHRSQGSIASTGWSAWRRMNDGIGNPRMIGVR